MQKPLARGWGGHSGHEVSCQNNVLFWSFLCEQLGLEGTWVLEPSCLGPSPRAAPNHGVIVGGRSFHASASSSMKWEFGWQHKLHGMPAPTGGWGGLSMCGALWYQDAEGSYWYCVNFY